MKKDYFVPKLLFSALICALGTFIGLIHGFDFFSLQFEHTVFFRFVVPALSFALNLSIMWAVLKYIGGDDWTGNTLKGKAKNGTAPEFTWANLVRAYCFVLFVCVFVEHAFLK